MRSTKQTSPNPRSTQLRVRLAAASAMVAAGLLAFGCTFLVDFQEKPDPIGGEFDAHREDASEDDAGIGGEDATGSDEGAGDGQVQNPCVGRPNGFSWDPADEYARCCNGLKVKTTVDAYCGTCEIACNKAEGQTCELFRDRFYCRGCNAGTECWSGCCSKQFGGGSCAASDCTTGLCNSAICTGGTVCVVPGDASNYCKY
jgi:hypothetical protein